MIGLGFGNQQVSASSWHKGTPSALRGTWKTRPKHFGSGRFAGYRVDTTYITKYTLSSKDHVLNGPTDVGSVLAFHAHYKYLGHHLYKFKGTSYGTLKSTVWIKWKAHNHIVIKGSNLAESYYR